MIGIVKFYNVEKGYGFIRPDSGEDDVFVHVTALQDAGIDVLVTNQQIGFDIGTNTRNGRSKAINLRLVA